MCCLGCNSYPLFSVLGGSLSVCFWPFVSVKNYINIAIFNVPLAPESGHSLRSG